MSGARLLVLLLMLFLCLTLSGQDLYEIRQTVVQPLRHYVGTPVVMRLRVAVSPAAEDRMLRSPEVLPTHPMIDITRIDVARKEDWEYDVTIAFTSFLPGSNRLPPVDLGAVTLVDVRIDTSSILDDTPPRPTLGPLVLPGTWRRVTLTLITLLLAPLLGYRLVRAVGHTVGRIQEIRRRRLPLNRLLRTIRRLRRQSAQPSAESELSGRRLYIVLTQAIREYLQGRFGLSVHAATTIEVRVLLGRVESPAIVDARLLDVLARGDLVKFGGVELEENEPPKVLDEVEQIALEYEEAGVVQV